MEITFELIDGLYTAEFEVKSNCNIHVERKGKGPFFILQRGTKTGKYAVVSEEDYNKTTIDVDMLGNIYPKYIKVTSASMPTYAEVNFAEQGGGGNSGDEKVYYFTVDNFTSVNFVDLGRLVSTLKFKLSDSSSAAKFGNPGDIVIVRPIDLGTSGTEFGDIKVAAAFMPELKLFSKKYNGTFNDIANELFGGDFLSYTTEITKDEYYDLTKL